MAAPLAAAAVGSAVFPAQRLQASNRRSTASFFPSIQLRAVVATKRFQLLACSAKQDTIERVCEIVKNQLAVEEGKIVSGESKFVDLGADSLDTVEIVMGLEEAFGITVDESSAQEIKTVEDAANLIDDLLKQKGA